MKKTVVQAIIGIRRNRWVSRGMCAVLHLGDSRKDLQELASEF